MLKDSSDTCQALHAIKNLFRNVPPQTRHQLRRGLSERGLIFTDSEVAMLLDVLEKTNQAFVRHDNGKGFTWTTFDSKLPGPDEC